jgi:glycine cleavage system H protein
MDRPADARYTKTHEWVKAEGDIGICGLTDYAVEHLSDLVYVELPPVGTQVAQNEAFGEIESVKAVVDLNSPVTGEVVEINEGLPDQLELLSDETYGAGWMIKVKMESAGELGNLMDKDAYNKYCETEEAETR